MPHTRDFSPAQTVRDRQYRQGDGDTPFRDLIQRDPTVCDNCFQLLFTRTTCEWWRGSFGWSEYEQWVPNPDAVTAMPDGEPTDGVTLTCAACGHRGMKSRPVPKDTIEEYAVHISQTLDAKEIEHNRDVLVMEVLSRNTSANQGRQDSHVFAPAVLEALRASG